MPATKPSKRVGNPRFLRTWTARCKGTRPGGRGDGAGLSRDGWSAPELGRSEGLFVVVTIRGGVGDLVGLPSRLNVEVEGAVRSDVWPQVGDPGGNAEAEGGCGFGVSKGDVDGCRVVL